MANKFECSDGSFVTQSTIDRKRSEAYRKKHVGNPRPVCGGCEKAMADDNGHIIAQKQCKTLHKTNLIWDPENMTNDCRDCHHIWENFKSGQWRNLKDVEVRVEYLLKHDPQNLIMREEFSKLVEHL